MVRTALSSQERSSESQTSQVLPARRTNCSTWRRWLALSSGRLASRSILNGKILLSPQHPTPPWAAPRARLRAWGIGPGRCTLRRLLDRLGDLCGLLALLALLPPAPAALRPSPRRLPP